MAALTFKQANATDANTLTPSVQFLANCTLGSYLLCVVFVTVASGNTITGVGDTKNTWTQVGPTITVGGSTPINVLLFQCQSNTSATPLAVTATQTGGTVANASIAIYEFTAQAVSSPLDAFVNTDGTTTGHVATISPVTASQTNEEVIILGCSFGTVGTISSSANGYTKGVYSLNPSNIHFFEYLAQNAAGSYGDAITFSLTGNFTAWALAVKSTTSAPPVTGGGQTGLQLAMDASLRNSGLRH